MKYIIGIDVGGSTTKIVSFGKSGMLRPEIVKATDPITSLYGAFGKFTSENGIALDDILKVIVTGVGGSHIDNELFGIEVMHAGEFECVGRGGLYISGLEKAVVISCGTGTAAVCSAYDDTGKVKTDYLGGTGIGGGTLAGLSKKLFGIENVAHVEALAESGSLDNVDLMVKDLTKNNSTISLPSEMTAANFGKLSDIATDSDVALGIINMVFETIGMIGVFAARNVNIHDIILTGNLISIKQARPIFEKMSAIFGYNFMIPAHAQFATAIGAALI